MAKVAGLVRKKSAFFYVRRIPETIKPMFGNKTQLTIPLQTSDPRVAANRARAKAAEVDVAFQKAKLGLEHDIPSATPKVSLAQLEAAARLYLYECELASRGAVPNRDDEEDAGIMLYHLDNPEDDWGGSIHMTASKIAKNCRLAIAPGDAYWAEFIELVHRAETEHQKRRLDRAKNRHGARIHDHFFEGIHDGAPPPVLGNQTVNTLSAVITRFESDPNRERLTESAAKKYIIPLAVLREVVGDDADIASISRAQCADTFDLISRLPSNYTKYKEFRGKTFREISECAKGLGKRLLSPTTIETHAHHLSAFFNFAVQKGLRETNPAMRLMPKSGKQSDGKPTFSSDELTKMISLLPEWSRDSNGRFWLPLVALFSGMRLGEIIWLTQNDIQTIDGVTVLALRKTDDRSLKTRGSIRNIPVHPTLKELGFLSLIKPNMPEEARLFPELSGENQKQAVDHFQKRFSYWLKKHVQVRKGISFHSFRHNFRDATREAELSIDAVRAIGGWARGTSIEERYGQGARASKLAQWIGKIRYPELDFSPLLKK